MPRGAVPKEEAETSVSAAATDASDETKKDTGPFAEGEKVLAYHGPLIYEAKTQKAEFRKKEWRYYVHYLGWSKSWDEWVDTKRLLKITDANIAKQKKVHREAAENRGKSKVGSSERKEGESKRGKKRKADANEAKEEEPEQVVKLPLSSHLKKQLIDDWKHITENNKLVPLPRNPTVNDILQKYLEARTKKASSETDDATGEVVDGLRSYFDKALPAMLLYSQERDQFNDVIPEESDISPSNIYGAEHLLRLFVKLPELLVYTNMEEASMAQLQAKLIDFLKFLQKNQTSFFLSSYVKRKK